MRFPFIERIFVRALAGSGCATQRSAFIGPATSGHSLQLRMALTAVLTLFLSLGWAAEEFSPAERALFMKDHLGSIRAPTTLLYSFRKSGSLEGSFDDKVSVALTATDKTRCCTAATEFLGGDRRVKLPEIESPLGNPVILHFLERDIREMQRLTKGQPNYFRKRIRLAVFQGAKITEIKVPYSGSMITAQQIVITPYTDDPLRPRYEKFADKQYAFTLSQDVPGGVYAIRALVQGELPGGPPLLLDEMVFDGTGAARRAIKETPKR